MADLCGGQRTLVGNVSKRMARQPVLPVIAAGAARNGSGRLDLTLRLRSRPRGGLCPEGLTFVLARYHHPGVALGQCTAARAATADARRRAAECEPELQQVARRPVRQCRGQAGGPGDWDLHAATPNWLWVVYFTQLKTSPEGVLIVFVSGMCTWCFAVRRTAIRMLTERPLDGLEIIPCAPVRSGEDVAGGTQQSDTGAQHTFTHETDRLADASITSLIGSIGDRHVCAQPEPALGFHKVE